MSPEQLTGGRIDHRSDIFAVGAVLYELMTGVQAFEGDLCGSVVSKILYAHPAPMTTLCTDIDPQLSSIVAGRWRRNPTNVIPTCGRSRTTCQRCATAFATRRPKFVPMSCQRGRSSRSV